MIAPGTFGKHSSSTKIDQPENSLDSKKTAGRDEGGVRVFREGAITLAEAIDAQFDPQMEINEIFG